MAALEVQEPDENGVSSNQPAEPEMEILHFALLEIISLNYSIVTQEEETCFKRLRELLQDDSCYFTDMLLPATLQSTVDAFPSFVDETIPLGNLIRQLVRNLEMQLENEEEMVHDINVRVVPVRFFTMLDDFIPLFVRGTLWDYNNIDLLDAACSSIAWSRPSTPGDGVTEGPHWMEDMYGVP